MPALQNKVAIITGAGSGIGQAIAIRLASEGASIVVDYRNQGNHPLLEYHWLAEKDITP